MNEIGGALRPRLRCHLPILSTSGRHPPSLHKIHVPRQHHRFRAATLTTTLLYGRPSSTFRCSGTSDITEPEPPEPTSVDCIGTGADVVCVVEVPQADIQRSSTSLWDWLVLLSPFFFWGTSMVAMKPVLPKTGPLFVSAFRLIPAGFLLVAFATSQRRNPPSGIKAWLSISIFALIDASCFQGFLAEGLQRTPAGLGSVIIDSQPLTVAVLAALLFGESIGFTGGIGLILGIVGLLLLEVPGAAIDGGSFSLWGSGEWWMFLAAQSMAVGTVLVRWVSNYSDPVMATGT